MAILWGSLILRLFYDNPVVGGGTWLAGRAITHCVQLMQRPMILLGLILLLLSILGFCVIACDGNILIQAYTFLTFFLVFFLLYIAIFVLVVTGPGSHWVQKYMEDDKNWRTVSSYIRQSNVCQRRGVNDLYLQRIQVSCCKPPVWCYDCVACKASVEVIVKQHWHKAAFFDIIIIISLLVAFFLACSAYASRLLHNPRDFPVVDIL